MSRSFTIAIAFGFCFVLAQQTADAQVLPRVAYYAPAPATYVQPTPVVQQAAYVQPGTIVYRPVVQPATAVVAPVRQTVCYTPRPVVAYRPAVQVVPVARTPVVTTRYRPFLGGTVSRVWYP